MFFQKSEKLFVFKERKAVGVYKDAVDVGFQGGFEELLEFGMNEAFPAGQLQNVQMALLNGQKRVKAPLEFRQRDVLGRFFAEIADRASQVTVFRDFYESGADVLVVLVAPAAIRATIALKFRYGLERLAFYVESFVQKTLGVLGNRIGKRSVLRAGSFQNDVLALFDLSGGNGLKTDGTNAFSLAYHISILAKSRFLRDIVLG